MIRSMTGFGEAERPVEDGVLRVQIKTVNHRFLNTSVRTPPGFDRVEHEIQHWLRPHLSRGHATISISLE
ncbi:MAG: YicC/YloC family endoribonuclease, partial [Longimicrobiales bacterium]